MKKLIFFLALSPLVLLAQDPVKTITGTVGDTNGPLPNVTVTAEKTNAVAVTDKYGKYTVQAEVGEVISYSYTGMQTVEIMVEDVTRILNITLYPKIEELDEVVVTKSNRKTQEELAEEYNSNNRLIKTAWGILDADTAPGNVWMLDEDSIMPIGICILDVLRNEFPGVNVIGDCTNGGYIDIRGRGSMNFASAAIYDVDGQIFVNTPIWVDVNNIKRIAILGNLAMTVKYGGLGSGGVVVINTISGNTSPKTQIDYARLKNNFYKNDALAQDEILNNEATYLKELYASSSFIKAKNVFEAYHQTFGRSPFFIVDAVHYFNQKWPDENFGQTVYNQNQALFDNDPVSSKAIAYAFEVAGLHAEAHELYKKVFILRPNYAQSYIDLATSYRQLRDSKMAATIFARYDYLVEEGFMMEDPEGFTPIIDREYNNLLALMGSEVISKRKSKMYLENEEFEGTRLVFEWNDSEAEFELQFVNPLNQFVLWQHSLEHNAERIALEKAHGYAIQEYLIDDSLKGLWLVNVKYLGNKSLGPTYLKATIYHNYGSAAQRRETKMFKLNLRGVNQQLFKISNTSTVVSK